MALPTMSPRMTVQSGSAYNGTTNNGTTYNGISDDGAAFICASKDSSTHAPPPSSASITPSTANAPPWRDPHQERSLFGGKQKI